METAEPTQAETSSPRGRIRYQRRGEGPAVVLVAGLGSTVRLWGELPELLARRLTVLTLDNPGVGGSRDARPFTLENAADDVAAVIADADGAGARLLGVSMGGTIAALAAARHPGLAERLVVASSAARLTPHHRRVLRFFQLLLDRLHPDEAGEALMTFAFGAGFSDRYPGFVDQAASLWAVDPADRPGVMSQIAHLRAGFDIRERLHEVACPTLVLAGEVDPIVPATSCREIADAIPRARFEIVPGAAHSVLAEGGPGLLATVTDFLAS